MEKGLACEIVGTDEVATLAEDVNSLYDKLLTSIEELKSENERTVAREREKSDFLRMTSHELKTPIASMLGLVEGMIYNVGDFKDHDTYLKKCRSILQEQSHLVQSILEATNLDMALEDSKENFFLDRLLEESLTSYQSLAQVKGFDFQVQLGPTQLVGNQVYLLKAIKNILDNAFRYSRPGATIRMVCQEDSLLVDNQVERLLEPEELKRIFQPLYRPDYSRNRKDGGTGIGLFLVQQILDKHQFSYAFYPLDKDTMRFIIHFY
nr:HAMP domain-containing sensor histidine kinase [Streptococcus oriscaviae]